MELNHKLVIAVSTRALFDLDAEHEIFCKSKQEYEEYQEKNMNKLLEKGGAFSLISKLLKLNDVAENAVEVIVLSQNSPRTGIRVMRSIKHYNIPITRFIFTGGDNPFLYLNNDDSPIDLFLSQNKEAVIKAIEIGIPAALLASKNIENDSDIVRIAFDGDSVIFDDQSELIYQSKGLAAFIENETKLTSTPLGDGPLKKLLVKLNNIREAAGDQLQIGLCTARGGANSIERVINTFEKWNIYPDHAAFLGGISKKSFLKAFKADIFFDDHIKHISDAKDHVTSAHVPFGGANG